jgi:hypothetical protein
MDVKIGFVTQSHLRTYVRLIGNPTSDKAKLQSAIDMAEPLSIAASVLVIIGAAEKTAKGLDRLMTLRNAPEYVLNDVNIS